MDNFLNEFLYHPEQYKLLINAYKGVFGLFSDNLEQAENNSHISKVLTYNKISFQRIDISDCIYSLSTLLSNTTVLIMLGISASAAYADKLSAWNLLSSDKKADILEITGYYALLTNYITVTEEYGYVSGKFNVVDFTMKDIYGNVCVRNVDYYYKDNKLFLLKSYSSDELYKTKYYTLEDITVDANTTEDKISAALDINYDKNFTKIDFNESLRSFIKATAKGPVFSTIEHSLSEYEALEDIKVFDKFNAGDEKKQYWMSNQSDGIYTDFDFLVSVPVSLLQSEADIDHSRLKYIQSFFEKIKPAYTNFVFSPELSVSDIYKVNLEATEKIISDMALEILDIIQRIESVEILNSKPLDDSVKVLPLNEYREEFFYCDTDFLADQLVLHDSEMYILNTISPYDKIEASESVDIQLIPKN